MKILLLSDGIYPYVLGGMQKHSYYLAKYLARKGVQVTIAHCVHQDDHPTDYTEDYTEQELKNIVFSCFTFPKISKLPGHYIKENYQYSKDVYNKYENEIADFDIIYAQGFSGWKFIEERKNETFATPIFINFHGVEMFQKAPSFKVKLQHYLLRGSAKWNLINADHVLSFGGHFVNIYDKIGVKKERILEMPIGIEENWLNDSFAINKKRKLVFIGRYERRKGIEELNEALTLIGSQNYTIEFIGPIPEDKRLNIPTCKYHGAIYSQNEIKEILRSADVLICPSHSEGMPTVIMEAMASGLAIIATDVGAVSKQINGNGWLLASPDVSLIKKAIEELIAIPEAELTVYKKRSITMIREQFLWKQVAGQFIDFVKLELKK